MKAESQKKQNTFYSKASAKKEQGFYIENADGKQPKRFFTQEINNKEQKSSNSQDFKKIDKYCVQGKSQEKHSNFYSKSSIKEEKGFYIEQPGAKGFYSRSEKNEPKRFFAQETENKKQNKPLQQIDFKKLEKICVQEEEPEKENNLKFCCHIYEVKKNLQCYHLDCTNRLYYQLA